MTDTAAFLEEVSGVLASIPAQVLSYDESEFWMIRFPYLYIENYALTRGLRNTAIALPLARGIHNGTHRKSSITRGGKSYRLPYVIHCLLVCRMLVDLKVPLPREEEDILLAAALCHDMIEDIPFPNHGWELVTDYRLDPRVYETVKLVSKRKDFTAEEEAAHFDAIARNRLSLLIKFSDRSNNVEDMYNMSVWKVHEYIGETDHFFAPMYAYGIAHYPELRRSLEILQDKIHSLTHASQILVDRCEAREQELQKRLAALQAENKALQNAYHEMWGR